MQEGTMNVEIRAGQELLSRRIEMTCNGDV